MTLTIDTPVTTNRDPQTLLNAVAPHVSELTVNIHDGGLTLWEREITLLLRDHTMVRDMAERILGQAVAYTLCSMQNRDAHLGVGKLVDVGVHQLILDTPVWWGLCRLYNGGVYQHHAPFLQRRNDGTCLSTSAFMKGEGWSVDEELWAIDGAECSPCNQKSPDSH